MYTKQVKLTYGEILGEIDALESMIGQLSDSLAAGADWLESEMGPNGPIANKRGVSWNHKVCWGLYEAGRIDSCFRILDWLHDNAMVSPAEYYFKHEPYFDKDMQRIYRFLTFGKVAEYLRYAPMTDRAHHNRAFEYQHPSGGCFNLIDPRPGDALEPLNTSFFGQWALAGGMIPRAANAADWLVELVELNAKNLAKKKPIFYYTRDAKTGRLRTNVPRNQDMNYYIDAERVKQPSWASGTTAALLADVYQVTGRRKYLDAAAAMADYESKCSYKQLFWPSKCKVAWGMAELYCVTGDPLHRRLCTDVNRVTFMDSQLECGGWSHVFYPLRENGPWRKAVYSGPDPHVPRQLPKHPSFGRLSGHEVAGEFLGEMGRSLKAFQLVLARLRLQKHEMEKDMGLDT